MSKPHILKVVEGVHMGLGHEGLKTLLKKHADVDVNKLTDGDLIMCLNTHGDKMKVIGCNGLVIGYLRMPNGHKIMKEALQFIPKTFGSGGFSYDAAVKQALETKLSRRLHVVGPLETARAMKQAGL
jgi:hypothetical protein